MGRELEGSAGDREAGLLEKHASPPSGNCLAVKCQGAVASLRHQWPSSALVFPYALVHPKSHLVLAHGLRTPTLAPL